jgi:hypothetical protein
MAEKFGNSRWVKEGYLDNRQAGTVVGRLTLAGVGQVDVYLTGDCKGEIAGKAIRFANSRFADDDLAGQVLGDFESPHVGEVSLISFDPHPLLAPHPYIEWFSLRRNHYRIELTPDDAWILTEEQAAELDGVSEEIRRTLGAGARSTRDRAADSDWV